MLSQFEEHRITTRQFDMNERRKKIDVSLNEKNAEKLPIDFWKSLKEKKMYSMHTEQLNRSFSSSFSFIWVQCDLV